MRPKYTENYRRERDPVHNQSLTANGLDRQFKSWIEEIADAETTSASILAFEGLTRVLEDRLTDPEFLEIVSANPERYPQLTALISTRSDPSA